MGREIILLLSQRGDWFMGLLLEHLRISLLSSFLACALGLALGIWISEYKKASKLTLGMVNFIYTIPSISLLGFFIPFSGVGNITAVIVLTLYALLPMVRNTYTGLTNIDSGVLEAATGMGSTPFQLLYKIKLPLAVPVILTGIRGMVTMTIALAGIASFIGAGGLGVAIYRGITTNNTALTITGSLLIALLALGMDFLLGIIEKLMIRHGRKKQGWKRLPVMLSLLVVCIALAIGYLNGGGQATLHIATKPMTEQYILGEILKEYIEEKTDVQVELTQGVGGGTANIQAGMEKGDFDLYPEYTGTGWNVVLKRQGLYNESMFPELNEQYQKQHQMVWMGMYGFNNTYGLVVRSELAEKYGLETYSDLANLAPQLTFGAEYDFYEREDGYDALCEAYGLSFGKTMDLDIGLKYQAIADGKIDVMNVFTTDGQLNAVEVKVLQDDRQFYPSYLCGNVVREEILLSYPQLRRILENLSNTIDDEKMAQMNYMVESEKKEPSAVAHEFLLQEGLMQRGDER